MSGAIGRLVLRRIGFAVPVLVIVALGVFLLAAASPFDPVYQYYGVEIFGASAADVARVRAELGLDDPVLVQFWNWLSGVLGGDLGVSRSFRQPVAQVVAERLPWTLLLAATGLAFAVVLALVLGTVAAWRQGGWVDRFVTAIGHALEGVPPFVLALLSIAVFSLGLGWLPVAGLTDAGQAVSFGQVTEHLVLPALVLGISQSPWLVLHVRQSMLTSLSEDHVTGARARGLAERVVVLRHALPTALLPFVTLIGARIPELVTGAVLVEEVFSWPGLAAAVVTSATAVDYPLLAILTLVATAAVLLGSLLADIAAILLDPRVAADG
ncbi:peptide/nickel transport system permease protein [Saccharopolyspora antimicrobica]|uniref:Peptide/nickel transport system permease protein n=1 Tax=Saccharopolyspora antimicrobica TaxID=455193 RepID=A0A1I4V6C0_9PSEU|nr:ABC transporter permease [Saccharopolyspora antimicrobica]RKT86144.1 peptide/nickel transport system permease protein [Saccharopolyspora antimicrobica]SFM96739.1 peptide/nickel transport system permease protein [Saccharopolyspora antimicrobica]